jgi:hypothetical protein
MYDTNAEVIAVLNREFDPSQIRQVPGAFGKMLDYIDYPAVLGRLDEAFGPDGWSFEVEDIKPVGDAVSGCMIARGKLTATFPDGTVVTKGQCGGNAYGQGDGGRGMKPDDAAKAAASDAVKKCAAMLGVGRYLSEKAPQQGGGGSYGGGQSNGYSQPSSNGYGAPRAASGQQQGSGFAQGQGGDDDNLICEECAEPLTETRFKDGTNWAPTQLAVFGRRKHSRILCMTHYRDANQAKRRAEEALQQVPF